MSVQHPLAILYVGHLEVGGTSLQRMQAMQALGHRVSGIESSSLPRMSVVRSLLHRVRYRLRRPLDLNGANEKIRAACEAGKFDVLWIDKGNIVRPETLAALKRSSPGTRVVGYSPDDMYQSHNNSFYFVKGLPLYDAFFTTKSYGVAELKSLGCSSVFFVDNAFDPALHRPMQVTPEDRSRFGGEVGFIGFYEVARTRSMLALAEAGIPVRIWGPGWEDCRVSHDLLRIERHSIWGEDYARVICATDINLGYLRKVNRDLSTTRSIEIPACGAFMLAERTVEHQRLFKEGEEAEFFADDRELIEKVKYYRTAPLKRQEIARRGRERCLSGGYSNTDRMAWMLGRVRQLTGH